MGFFSKLFKLIAIIIAIIAIVYLIIAAMVALGFGALVPEILLFAGLESAWIYVGAAFLLGTVSAMISPEGFHEVVDSIADGASTVTSAVGNVIGSAGSGLVDGLFGSINWLLVGGVVGGYYLLTSDSPDTKSKKMKTEKKNAQQPTVYPNTGQLGGTAV